MAKRFLRFRDLKDQKSIPWCRMHIDRMEKEGKFPKRVHLGPMTVAWAEDEIDAFLANKFAERDMAA